MQVKSTAESAAKGLLSIGMALTVCTIPGGVESDRLDGNLVEYGLGIHGEPGVKKTELKSSADTAKDLVDRLVAAKKTDGPFALLVNNLGTLPPLEMSIVVRDSVRALQHANVNVTKLGVMTGMTSLNMAGFSLSLCDLSGCEEYLDAEATAPAWVPFRDLDPEVKTVPCPEVDVATNFIPPASVTPEGEKIKKVIRAACDALVAAEPELTAADKIVGDGDCGLTLKQGAERITADLDRYPVDSLAKTLDAIGTSAAQSMGGTSGVLYRLGLSASGAAIVQNGDWKNALAAGTDAISRYGGAKEGMRTMLDALYPAVRCDGGIREVANAAKAGAIKTGAMGKAGAGRSSYVPSEALQGTPDPGATAVGIWLSAIADVLE